MLVRYFLTVCLPGHKPYLELRAALHQAGFRILGKKDQLQNYVQSPFVWTHKRGPESNGQRHKCWTSYYAEVLHPQKVKSLPRVCFTAHKAMGSSQEDKE